MSQAPTLPALLDAAVARDPARVWLLHESEVWTLEEVAERVASAAAGLAERGVRRGDVCLATCSSTPSYLFAWLAAAHLGALYLGVDPRATSSELAGWIDQSRPRLVVTDDLLIERVQELTKSGRADVAEITSLFETDGVDAPPAQARADDPAFLIPTSGTTGRSKLVVHSQRTYVLAGEAFSHWLGLRPDDRLITALPLFHINAPVYSALGSLAGGQSLVLLPRFSASTFVETATRYGATQFNSVGAMLEMLMRQPLAPSDSENSLRLCYTVPTPSRQRQLEIEQRFNIELVSGYALTESPYGLIWPTGTRPYETVGSPRQHPALGEINRVRVAPNGELELQNPATMLGYYEMPDETSHVLVDGWLRTGDLVRDNGDGTFTFIARIKEVIRRRGENLSPLEVEAILESHQDVVEAAVIGVPSELSDEDVKAFVVIAPGSNPSPAELRDWTLERLTPFKAPRYVEFVTDLPHTPTGRIAKHKLSKERTAAEWDAEAISVVPT